MSGECHGLFLLAAIGRYSLHSSAPLCSGFVPHLLRIATRTGNLGNEMVVKLSLTVSHIALEAGRKRLSCRLTSHASRIHLTSFGA